MENTKIVFIGGGNMAYSLIGGLLNNNVPVENLAVADPNPQPPAAHYPVRLYQNNREALDAADVLVLAVKPQMMPDVCKELAAHLASPPPLVVSIAAGIQLGELYRWLGCTELPVVRVMPNTPSLVQSGAAGLFAGKYVNKEQRELAENILRAVGTTVWLQEEALLDTVTALSGSGPAYFFLLMEILEQSAAELGLSAQDARLLTLQTAYGAAKMALESNEDAAVLRARVTSKGGTTEQALKVLQDGALRELFEKALRAAHQRSIELSRQFGEM